MAFFIGIAPSWFLLVGLAAAWPFLQLWRSFARFDRGATTTLTAVAASLGVAGALTWRSLAFPLFNVFPSLAPSPYAQNGLAVLATLGVVVAIVATRRKLVPDSAPVHTRVAEPIRFAEMRDDSLATEEAAQAEEQRRAARSRHS